MTDVIVPYAGDCSHRKRALDWTTAAHSSEGRNVIVGYGNAARWNKAEAVRDALDRSEADIIVLADCDVWCDDLAPAIEAARESHWVVPHGEVTRLNEQGTTDFLNGDRTNLGVEERHRGMKGGGIVILSRETYETCPLDSRFVGWGGEDQAFGYALQTLYGSPRRFKSPLFHLWHPPAPRRSRYRGSKENQMLLARYFETYDAVDTDGMRELIGEARGNRGLLHHPNHHRHARSG